MWRSLSHPLWTFGGHLVVEPSFDALSKLKLLRPVPKIPKKLAEWIFREP
jgi:hypothetical protein